MDRDKLEQQAMQQLQRGNTEKALDAYMQILRVEPKDRRIRQKVAELYLTLGRKPEAIRHFTDVARGLRSSGQERAAISVYMQLLSLKPEDHEARAELAECLESAGRRQEARKVWDEAFHVVDRREPRKAIEYARRVARLSPGEVPQQVRVAELLEANRQEAEAFDAWTALGAEARRFGRADDQGRFLERALKLRPDDMGTLLSAAEARVVQGEARVALAHLQQAYGQDPRNVRLLTLLGRALQALGQVDKARKVWVQAARRQAEEGDREAQVDALRHALECGEDDPSLRNELERANSEARRQRVRLVERSWAQPVTDDEVRVLTRSQVLRRYGFPDRARATLEAAPPEVKAGVAWQVHQGELLVAIGEKEAGIAALRGIRPPGAAAALELADRLEVLGVVGVAQTEIPREETEEAIVDEDTHGPLGTGADRAEPEPEPEDTDENNATEPDALSSMSDAQASWPAFAVDSDEARGDDLAARGDSAGAVAAYRRALARQPANTELLLKIGEAMSRPSAATPSAPPRPALPVDAAIPLDLPDPGGTVDFGAGFGEVDPDALDASVDVIAEARAHVAIGQYEQALDLLRGVDDIEALVVQALASRGLGRNDGVQGRLERAVQSGQEHHPAYVEALWELAGLYLLRNKAGNAERLLDEVSMLDPGFRPVEMAARRRGLELLRAR